MKTKGLTGSCQSTLQSKSIIDFEGKKEKKTEKEKEREINK